MLRRNDCTRRSPSGMASILAFLVETPLQNSKVKYTQRGINCIDDGRNLRFSSEISETVRDGRMHTIDQQCHQAMSVSMPPMTSRKAGRKGPMFLRRISYVFSYRLTK